MADQAIINNSTLTEIADAIRTKTGKSDTFLPSNMPEEILAIETGSDVSGVTAGAGDVRNGKKFMNSSGALVDGTLTTRKQSDLSVSDNLVSVPAGIYDTDVSKSVTTATQATPSISVNSSGLITAQTTQSAGYVSAGKKSATLQLSSSQDSNFIASNIKDGVNIFGVKGSYGQYISQSAVYFSSTKYITIKLPSGFKDKYIMGWVNIFDKFGAGGYYLIFDRYCFNTSEGGIYLAGDEGGRIGYISNYVTEAEGVTGLCVNFTSLIDSDFTQNVNGDTHIVLL